MARREQAGRDAVGWDWDGMGRVPLPGTSSRSEVHLVEAAGNVESFAGKPRVQGLGFPKASLGQWGRAGWDPSSGMPPRCLALGMGRFYLWLPGFLSPRDEPTVIHSPQGEFLQPPKSRAGEGKALEQTQHHLLPQHPFTGPHCSPAHTNLGGLWVCDTLQHLHSSTHE